MFEVRLILVSNHKHTWQHITLGTI